MKCDEVVDSKSRWGVIDSRRLFLSLGGRGAMIRVAARCVGFARR